MNNPYSKANYEALFEVAVRAKQENAALRAELRRLTKAIDRDAIKEPDGGIMDTTHAHALLGDFNLAEGEQL